MVLYVIVTLFSSCPSISQTSTGIIPTPVCLAYQRVNKDKFRNEGKLFYTINTDLTRKGNLRIGGHVQYSFHAKQAKLKILTQKPQTSRVWSTWIELGEKRVSPSNSTSRKKKLKKRRELICVADRTKMNVK